MTHTILVTGASGTVGSSVLSCLLEYPVKIKAAIHQTHPHSTNNKVETIKLDFNDSSTYFDALKDVEGLFLLPPASANGHAQVIPFLEYIKENAPTLKHIVALTAMGIVPNDGSAYGDIENIVQELGIPYTILRPNWFMQNFNTYFIEGVRQGVLSLPAGEAPTSFVDTRDIGAAAAKILAEDSHHWEAFTLTGWQSLTYREAAEIISLQINMPVEYQPVTSGVMRTALKEQGWQQESIDEMLDLFDDVRNGKFAMLTQDISKLLGTAPRTFEQYATDYKKNWVESP